MKKIVQLLGAMFKRNKRGGKFDSALEELGSSITILKQSAKLCLATMQKISLIQHSQLNLN